MRRIRLTLIIAGLAAVLLTAAPSVSATGSPVVAIQHATPTAGRDIPKPSECTVEPRSDQEFRALYRDAVTLSSTAASPTTGPVSPTPPPGKPAGDAIVAEINASWREFIACLNAGDLARVFALTSDDKLRRDFVVDIANGATEDMLVPYLLATPTALDPATFVPVMPFPDATMLDDGRVAVVGEGEHGDGEVLIFIKDGDRWIVDDQWDLSPVGTPAP